jgi:uncharacterized protein YciI
MLYVIIGENAPGSQDKWLEILPQHRGRLRELQEAGRLVLAGPCPAIDSPDPGPAGYAAEITVAEFDSLDAARAWADADPHATAGIWSNITIRPFQRASAT